MTSSEGLLNFVNQLQNLEVSMGIFLLELSLKVSAFYDTKFMVIVDFPEGRKVAGKPEMVQAFVDGHLQPLPSDCKVELKTVVPDIVETPLVGRQTPTQVGDSTACSTKRDARPRFTYPNSTAHQSFVSTYDYEPTTSGRVLPILVESPVPDSPLGRKRPWQSHMKCEVSPAKIAKEVKIEANLDESCIIFDEEDEDSQKHPNEIEDDDYQPEIVAKLAEAIKSRAPNTTNHHHHHDLNGKDQLCRIAMAQQYSYDDVKVKDSPGFKVIASIVYAKARELAAECPIPNYKGPEVNNFIHQEYLAWFAQTFPRLCDTKAIVLFRSRMQIVFQKIRKRFFPQQQSQFQQQQMLKQQKNQHKQGHSKGMVSLPSGDPIV